MLHGARAAAKRETRRAATKRETRKAAAKRETRREEAKRETWRAAAKRERRRVAVKKERWRAVAKRERWREDLETGGFQVEGDSVAMLAHEAALRALEPPALVAIAPFQLPIAKPFPRPAIAPRLILLVKFVWQERLEAPRALDTSRALLTSMHI